MKIEIPDKLYYKINEVSEITKVKPYILRYWESEFNVLKPEKDSNDQRRYKKKDIETILLIKQLLYEQGYTIAGAKKKIKELKGHPEELFKDEVSLSSIKEDIKKIIDLTDSLDLKIK